VREYLAFVGACLLAYFASLWVFPEWLRAIDRWRVCAVTWPSRGLDGLHMGSGADHAQLFVVFDPPWWKANRWIWWLRTMRSGIPTGRVPVTFAGISAEVRVFEKQPTHRLVNFRRKHAG
jgi:hypothetical protein